MLKNIYDYTIPQLKEIVVSLGEPAFRAKQLVSWLYPVGISSFEDMHNISKKLRRALREEYTPVGGEVVYEVTSPSNDSSKFALKLYDGAIIECVVLASKKRRTLCISSQVGCALGCTFCETGKLGLKRNLSTGEILYQLIVANQFLAPNEERITNIVFMGMGEALANFDNFVQALEMIELFGIGRRKITVSTAGVLPHIQRLIDEKVSIELAISLNASSDEERSAIMPINKRYPIKELMAQARKYADFRGRPVTFEYVLIAGKNDSKEAATRLISLMKNFPGKINLIPLNDCTTDGMSTPDDSWIDRFSKLLYNGGVTVTVRRSGGREIDGACGQLAGKVRNTEEHQCIR